MPAAAHARVYRVKKGDWLGRIGRRFLPGDPFAKNGSVKKLVHLNPDIHNPDAIDPGTLVYIPDAGAQRGRKGSGAVAERTAHKMPRNKAATAAAHREATAGGVEITLKCPPPTPLAPALTPAPPAAACRCATTTCTASVAAVLQNMPEAATTAASGGSTQHHLRLRLAPYFRFSQLAAQDDATGAALTLASRYNTGLSAGISVNALESLEIILDMRGGMVDYTSPDKNSALLTSALFSYAVDLGAELTILHRLGLYLGLDFGNEPFSTSDSTQVQEVAMINLPAVMGALRLTALRFERWQLGIEARGAYKLGVAEKGYTVRPGAWLYAGAYWHWINANDSAWMVSAGYSQRQQDTTLITQTDKAIAIEVAYRWSLGSMSQAL